MRTCNNLCEGKRMQGLFREAIRLAGQSLFVSAAPARQLAPGSVRRRELYATIELPNANDIGHLSMEADYNAASPMPIVFTFAGGVGVRENDRLEFDGYFYVLLNALPQTYQGVEMGIRCVGVRMLSSEVNEQRSGG